jgi:hypothetical protein
MTIYEKWYCLIVILAITFITNKLLFIRLTYTRVNANKEREGYFDMLLDFSSIFSVMLIIFPIYDKPQSDEASKLKDLYNKYLKIFYVLIGITFLGLTIFWYFFP